MRHENENTGWGSNILLLMGHRCAGDLDEDHAPKYIFGRNKLGVLVIAAALNISNLPLTIPCLDGCKVK
uniref:Uncharacterized protein n=1 Tax=Oryza punctata TaxID=4537 RepID=A0A0E0M039_ORYPU